MNWVEAKGHIKNLLAKSSQWDTRIQENKFAHERNAKNIEAFHAALGNVVVEVGARLNLQDTKLRNMQEAYDELHSQYYDHLKSSPNLEYVRGLEARIVELEKTPVELNNIQMASKVLLGVAAIAERLADDAEIQEGYDTTN